MKPSTEAPEMEVEALRMACHQRAVGLPLTLCRSPRPRRSRGERSPVPPPVCVCSGGSVDGQRRGSRGAGREQEPQDRGQGGTQEDGRARGGLRLLPSPTPCPLLGSKAGLCGHRKETQMQSRHRPGRRDGNFRTNPEPGTFRRERGAEHRADRRLAGTRLPAWGARC